MKPENLARIDALEDSLVDVLCDELNPEHWPGHGKRPQELDKEENSGRYFAKKAAQGTLTLLVKCESLRHYSNNSAQKISDKSGTDLIAESVAKAQKQADQLLDRYQQKVAKIHPAGNA